MSENKSKVSEIIKDASENLENIIQADKIIGKQIVNAKGQTVIPVCKLTVGLLGGGGEYGSLKISEKLGERFAGGNLVITSIKPECFVIDNGNGFEISSCESAVDSLLTAITKVLNKVK